MPVEAMLAVVDGDAGYLADWLEDELRGRVRRVPEPVPSGVLGAGLAQPALSLASGGTATALARAIIAWLRRSTGPVTVRVSRRDGSTIELSASRVRVMGAKELREQVDQLAVMARPGDDVPAEPGSGGNGGD
jgi:Effector Associated Constant Component 1